MPKINFKKMLSKFVLSSICGNIVLIIIIYSRYYNGMKTDFFRYFIILEILLLTYSVIYAFLKDRHRNQ